MSSKTHNHEATNLKQVLHGDAFQLVLERLAPELGRTDRDRLLNLAKLATPTGIRLSDCLPATGTDQQKQADFRYFRKQVSDAAIRAGVDLQLAVDSKKRDKPEDRRCTFLGADPSATLVENYNRAVTKDLDAGTLIPVQGLITSSSALENQKTVVRFFVSYAHDDAELAEKLLTLLRKQLNASKRYEAHLWYDGQIEIGADWEDRINKAMAASALGLLLLSPGFLTSKFITSKELPAFMAREKTGKIPLPVALVPVDLQRHDLKGL